MASIKHNHANDPISYGVLIYGIAISLLIIEMALQVTPSILTNTFSHTFGFSSIQISFISAFFFLSYTAMQIPVGFCINRYGLRKSLLFALTTTFIGATLFLLAPYYYVLLVSRLLMGVGGSFAFVCSLSAASKITSTKRFGILAGLTQLFAAMGAIAGQSGLSLILNTLGWHTFFAVTICLLGILIFLILRHTEIKEISQESSQTGNLKSLFQLLQNARVIGIGLYALLSWASILLFAGLWGVQFLHATYNLPTGEAALVTSTMWLAVACFAPLIGSVLPRSNDNKLLLFTCMSLLGALATFAITSNFNYSLPIVIALVVLIGAAGSTQSLSFAYLKEILSEQERAIGFGLNNMFIVISGFIFQAASGFIIDYSGGVVSSHAMVNVMCLMPGCFLIASITTALLFIFEKLKTKNLVNSTNFHRGCEYARSN